MHRVISPPATSKTGNLRELALFFLLLGTTAFGGPAGHVALMEDHLVTRKKWLTREKFLDLWGASNLIPGPSSSELAIHIGYLHGGWAGLVVAGVCFVLPAAVIVGLLAWAYVHFSQLPATSAILYGIKPVVIAVIAQALWSLSRSAVKSKFLGLLGLASLMLAAFGVQPMWLLLLSGLAAVIGDWTISGITPKPKLSVTSFALLNLAGAGAAATPFSLVSLFFVFLKIGAVVFGSGYVLLAFLRTDLVVHRGWLTDSQLIDAVAIGQLTPGPVFTTATFIGYLLARTKGAFAATIGIFLPAFLLVAASGPLIPRIRGSRHSSAFLDGVIVGSLALMAVVSWQLARTSIVDFVTATIALVSAIALIRFRINSTWLVLMGALAGLLFHSGIG